MVETMTARPEEGKTQDRVSYIFGRLNKMDEAKKQYSSRWKNYELLWKMFAEEKKGKDAWRSTLPDTWTYATIKTAQSAFLDSDVLPVFSRREDEDESKTSDLRDLFSFVADKGDLKKELYYARLDAFKLGNGCLKTVYLKDEREIYNIDSFDAETNVFKYTKKIVRDFDDVKTIRVSPYLFFVDELTRADFGTARDCAEIEILGYDDAKRIYGHLVPQWETNIKKNSGMGINISEISSTTTGAQTAAKSAIKDGGTSNVFRIFAPIELSDDEVQIIHYWNKINDSYEIVIQNYGAQIATNAKPSPIPYTHKQLPFSPIQYSPYSGDEFWAAGIIEVTFAEIKAHRGYREMKADRQMLSLFSPAFSDVNDEIDQRVMPLGPLTVIRTKGGTPKTWQIPGLTNADIALNKDYEDAIKRASGIDERLLGFAGGKSRMTATEVSFIREASLARLREFMFLYKQALIRTVRLKVKLFEQYYASPIKREPMVKGDGAVKQIKVLMKEFKVKTGNVYKSKEVYEGMFSGDINDVELDMRVLLPMTPAQLVTKWAQVLRDLTPFAQAGIINIDLDKIIGNYLKALETDLETLRKDVSGESAKLAEAEHLLLADSNTSEATLKALPNGTPEQYLTEAHLRVHKQLADRDDEMGESERRNMAKHIAQDTTNWFKKVSEAKVPENNMANLSNNPLMAQLGGVSQMGPVETGMPPRTSSEVAFNPPQMSGQMPGQGQE